MRLEVKQGSAIVSSIRTLQETPEAIMVVADFSTKRPRYVGSDCRSTFFFEAPDGGEMTQISLHDLPDHWYVSAGDETLHHAAVNTGRYSVYILLIKSRPSAQYEPYWENSG